MIGISHCDRVVLENYLTPPTCQRGDASPLETTAWPSGMCLTAVEPVLGAHLAPLRIFPARFAVSKREYLSNRPWRWPTLGAPFAARVGIDAAGGERAGTRLQYQSKNDRTRKCSDTTRNRSLLPPQDFAGKARDRPTVTSSKQGFYKTRKKKLRGISPTDCAQPPR